MQWDFFPWWSTDIEVKKIFYFHRINLLSQGYKMDAYEKYIIIRY